MKVQHIMKHDTVNHLANPLLQLAPVVQIPVPRDARNLMDRLLCDVDDRLGSNGVQELKVQQQTESIHVCSMHVCC